MRSLLNIIKASQYDELKGGESAKKTEAEPPHSSPTQVAREAKDQHQAIVNDAFKKAKNIVEAAQNYTLNQLKESTMRMNEECAQMKIRSYEDGYSQGLAEGKNEGYSIGYQAGYEEGLKRAEKENQTVVEDIRRANEEKEKELLNMLKTVENRKTEILERFEADIQHLALTIAQKVIRKEVSVDEKAIKAIILDAMDSYRNQEWVKISVSRNTAELLARADSKLVEALKEVSDNVKIVSSFEMKDGDCQIELPDRLIDAGVDTQMNCIKAALEQ
jgi:flagellar biosynthesis/type III secretory pathway protein FliH